MLIPAAFHIIWHVPCFTDKDFTVRFAEPKRAIQHCCCQSVPAEQTTR